MDSGRAPVSDAVPPLRWPRALLAVALVVGGAFAYRALRGRGAAPSAGDEAPPATREAAPARDLVVAPRAFSGRVADAVAASARGDLEEAARKVAEARLLGAADADLPEPLARAVTAFAAPPVLELDSPADGAVVEDVRVRVAGRLQTGRPSDVLRVDGQPVAVVAGRFEAQVELPDEGVREIRLQVDDRGRARLPAAVTRTVRRVAPWRNRLDEAVASAGRGDFDTAKALVARALEQGAKPSAVPGSLRQSIEAYDAPPVLTVTAPLDGFPTFSSSVRVAGTLASARPDERVLVNGTEVRASPGAFEATVALPEDGDLEVRVTVVHRSTTRAFAVRTVERVPRPVAPSEFLRGWAEAIEGKRDEESGYPLRIRRLRDGGEMALVPAGVFQMGRVVRPPKGADPLDAISSQDAMDVHPDRPRHWVTLTRPYYMDVTEVTNHQFEAFVRATGYATTAETEGHSVGFNQVAMSGQKASSDMKGLDWRSVFTKVTLPGDRGQHPVVMVTWADADAFARWAGASLPTEAQWERAVREGKEDRKFTWGDAWPPDVAVENLGSDESWAFFHGQKIGYADGFRFTSPVGSFPANAFGLHDLVGNVREWCANWFYDYGSARARDPVGPETGEYRVLRGNDWYGLGGFAMSSARGGDRPGFRREYVGFRLAKSLR